MSDKTYRDFSERDQKAGPAGLGRSYRIETSGFKREEILDYLGSEHRRMSCWATSAIVRLYAATKELNSASSGRTNATQPFPNHGS
jgi:hypothetical protein